MDRKMARNRTQIYKTESSILSALWHRTKWYNNGEVIRPQNYSDARDTSVKVAFWHYSNNGHSNMAQVSTVDEYRYLLLSFRPTE